MNFNITGKHIEITEAIRDHAYDKASKLPRYYNVVKQVEVIIDGGSRPLPSVEVIARGEHNKVFVATESGADVYACIDVAVHKIERQLIKTKQKERDNKYSGPSAPALATEES